MVTEDLVHFVDGQGCLSQPETQELFLGTEADALSPEPQKVGREETERQQAALKEQAGKSSREPAPVENLEQALEEHTRWSKSTLERGLQHNREKARSSTLSFHHRFAGP